MLDDQESPAKSSWVGPKYQETRCLVRKWWDFRVNPKLQTPFLHLKLQTSKDMPWDKVQHLRGSEGYWLVIIKGPRIIWFNYSRWSMRYPLVNLQKLYMENHHFLYNGYINYMWAIFNSYVKLPEGSRLAISPGELVYVVKLQNNSLSKVWTSSRHSGVTSPGRATRSAIYYKMKLLNRCKQPYHPSFILMFILWWAKSRLGQVGESPHKIITQRVGLPSAVKRPKLFPRAIVGAQFGVTPRGLVMVVEM